MDENGGAREIQALRTLLENPQQDVMEEEGVSAAEIRALREKNAELTQAYEKLRHELVDTANKLNGQRADGQTLKDAMQTLRQQEVGRIAVIDGMKAEIAALQLRFAVVASAT